MALRDGDPALSGMTYDKGGRRTSVRDPLGRISATVYDPYGRVDKVVDPASGVTRFTYDNLSRLVSLTDAKAQKTRWEYDTFGRVAKTIDPMGGEETFTYNPAGQLQTRTDRRGIVATFGYDGLGRLATTTYSDGTPGTSMSYDARGRLTSAANGTDTLTWTYDDAGQMLTETSQRNGTTLSYGHDALGRREQMSLDGQLFASYSYDVASRLTSIVRNGTSFGFSYDAASRRTAMTQANGTTTSYAYDVMSRIESITAQNAGQSVLSAAYTHDAAGNRTTKTLDGVAEGYGYDVLSRLTGVTRGATPAESYSYDAVGNRVTSHAAPSHTYDARNRMLQAGSAAFAYDPAGNTTRKQDGADVWNYVWNAKNELQRVCRSVEPAPCTDTNATARFAYDPLGRRVGKVAGGVTTAWAYDGMDILRETTSGGSSAGTYLFIHGPGIDEPLARENVATGTREYLHADALGSIAKLTGDSGTTVHEYHYSAFGEIEQGGERAGASFTGREWDPDASLHFYRARWLDPSSGRFLSEDPIGFRGGLNFFAYVHNRPTVLVDPFGLESGNINQKVPGPGNTPTFPFNNRTVDDIFNDAMTAARNSGLPGPHNGPQDAFRHCLASCMMTREFTEFTADAYGWANEKRGDWTHGQERGERAMDDRNNACGRRNGQTATSTGDCQNRCMQSLINGELTPSYAAGSTNPYGSY